MNKPFAQTLGVIPARYGSSRFLGKPLFKILGKTLIQRTYENAKLCPAFDNLVVATDNAAIYDHVASFGGKVVMTSEMCLTGTDRIAELLVSYREFDPYSYIVNIQGDEPCVPSQTFISVIEALKNSDAEMATAVVKLESEEEAYSPHVVKCVMDRKGYALYFSRALIPAGKSLTFRPEIAYYRHMGMYAFKRSFVLEYGALAATPLQLAEDLEQLKILEQGYRIKVAVVADLSIGVDTPEDIRKVEQYLCQRNTFSSPAESFRPSVKA